jgi:hypothetical protein
MPTTINASNTSGGAIITPDGSGVLELQSGGVTGLTVSGANVTVAGTLAATGGLAALTSPVSVIGNATAGAEIRLPEDTDNGANYVAIKAPNALAANLTFTLPTADGTNGQYLQTNGSGQLAFATVPTTSPGGTTGQIQFNNAGVFGGVTAVPAANGGTGLTAPGTAGNLLTSNGTTWTSAAAPLSPVQYPQNSQSANYTLVLGDAGKQIFHPVADATFRTYTIPANASVAFPIGTVVLFTVENGGRIVNVTCGDTLVFGSGVTGSVAVAANNTLMAIKVTATKWMANYLYQTGAAQGITQSIAVAHATTPFVSAYPWSGSGFGTKFTNPAALPAGLGSGVAFSPSGNAIAVAHSTYAFFTAYPWSGSGFGTKFTDPATLPTGNGRGVAFSPAGDAIAVAHETSPFITAYPWSGSGFGTKFTNPATLPTNYGNSVAFSPAGDAIAVAHATTPFVSAYPWSGSGFGTKFTNPATLPTDGGNGVAFSPSGDAIAVVHATTPFITAYPWSGSGFGTKFTNPAALPAGNGFGVAFSPAGDAIAVAHATTPFVSAYPWSGSGFGTKFTNPATLPTDEGYGVAFSPAGDAIAVAHYASPNITAYPWSGSGFGTKFTNPATLPTGYGNSVAFTVN